MSENKRPTCGECLNCAGVRLTKCGQEEHELAVCLALALSGTNDIEVYSRFAAACPSFTPKDTAKFRCAVCYWRLLCGEAIKNVSCRGWRYDGQSKW